MKTCDATMLNIEDLDFIDEMAKKKYPHADLTLRENRKLLIQARKEAVHELVAAFRAAEVHIVMGGCIDDRNVIAVYDDEQVAEVRAEQENKMCNGLDAHVDKWKVERE